MIRYSILFLLAFKLLIAIFVGETFASDNPKASENNLQISERTNFSIGESIRLNSTLLAESRILNIYLPSSYVSNPDKSYPVIYLLDGSSDEDFVHISGLVQFGSFPWINQLPESIVVGIANVDRKRDFTFPSNNIKDKQDLPTAGNSDIFMQFIESELQPLIARNYRINSNSTIIGQSLGGLLATEILFKSPELFDNYIIISPSLWWDDESLLNYKPKSYSSSKSIYVGVGKEGETMERVAKALYEKLNNKKFANTKIHFEYFERLSHGDTLHLAAYDAFEKIFRNAE